MKVDRTKHIILLLLALILLPTIVNAQGNAEMIGYGDTVIGNFSKGRLVKYSFEGAMGDQVTISATPADSSKLILNVRLLMPDGTTVLQVGEPDPSVAGRKALEFRLTSDGTFVITVQAVNGSGEFELWLDGQAGGSSDTDAGATPLPDDVLFQDDFDNNAADWELSEGTTPTLFGSDSVVTTSSIENGAQVIQLSCEQSTIHQYQTFAGLTWTSAPGFTDWSKAPIINWYSEDQTYDFEVTIRKVESTTGKYVVGIAIGVEEAYKRYEAFGIDQTGTWSTFLATSTSDGDRGFDPYIMFPSTPVDFLNGVHTLGMYIENGSFWYLVDGQRVSGEGHLGMYAPGWDGGSLGVMVSCHSSDAKSTVRVEFDKVVLRHIQ